ncbi:hypothetical protein OH77DRAFT_1524786 [Trametes cingulata]|nr:hypothetical protein OH77DRAFT_1524786 [Trametes cingulata]
MSSEYGIPNEASRLLVVLPGLLLTVAAQFSEDSYPQQGGEDTRRTFSYDSQSHSEYTTSSWASFHVPSSFGFLDLPGDAGNAFECGVFDEPMPFTEEPLQDLSEAYTLSIPYDQYIAYPVPSAPMGHIQSPWNFFPPHSQNDASTSRSLCVETASGAYRAHFPSHALSLTRRGWTSPDPLFVPPSGSRHAGGDDDSLWVIPQDVYSSGKRRASTGEVLHDLPRFSVNVAVRDAVNADVLAQLMADRDPLASGFADPTKARRNQKYTVRIAVTGLPLNKPTQRNEYSKGEKSPAVQALLRRHGHQPPTESQPLSRIELVESVGIETAQFIRFLAEKDTPLKFRDCPVQVEHLFVVDIFRPTHATVQPTLAIDRQYRALYGPL